GQGRQAKIAQLHLLAEQEEVGRFDVTMLNGHTLAVDDVLPAIQEIEDSGRLGEIAADLVGVRGSAELDQVGNEQVLEGAGGQLSGDNDITLMTPHLVDV